MKVMILSILLGNLACGVRGDPIPPGAPAELGHGSPRYKNIRNRFVPALVPSSEVVKKADEKEEKEDDK